MTMASMRQQGCSPAVSTISRELRRNTLPSCRTPHTPHRWPATLADAPRAVCPSATCKVSAGAWYRPCSSGGGRRSRSRVPSSACSQTNFNATSRMRRSSTRSRAVSRTARPWPACATVAARACRAREVPTCQPGRARRQWQPQFAGHAGCAPFSSFQAD